MNNEANEFRSINDGTAPQALLDNCVRNYVGRTDMNEAQVIDSVVRDLNMDPSDRDERVYISDTIYHMEMMAQYPAK